MEITKSNYFGLRAVIWLTISIFTLQVCQSTNYKSDEELIQEATVSFPRGGDLVGFTVVDIKPDFGDKEYIIEHRPTVHSAKARMYTVYRKVPSSATKYTEHIAYVRSFNGREAEVEWDPITSVETNVADGILAQYFAPSLFTHGQCKYQVKTPYRAIYDHLQNQCSLTLPYQDCCPKENRGFRWSWSPRLRVQVIPEVNRNSRDTKTSVNLHSDSVGDDTRTKDHYNSGYKHVKNRAVNVMESPLARSSVAQFLAFLKSRNSFRERRASEKEADENDRSKRRTRTKRQLPMIAILSTKVKDQDIANIQSQRGHEMLKKLERMYTSTKHAAWKQGVLAKYRKLSKPSSRFGKIPENPDFVKVHPKISGPARYTSVGKFYGSILDIYPGVVVVLRSNKLTPASPKSLLDAQTMFLFYGTNPQSGAPLTEDPEAAFTGSSTCPYDSTAHQYVKSLYRNAIDVVTDSKDIGQLLEFHLSHLRAYCVPNLQQNIRNLFEIGLLKMKSGLRVTLNIDHKLLRDKTPNRDNWNNAISAILFYGYTNAYMDSMEHKDRDVNDNRDPSGKTISWSVRTLSRLIFRGLELLDLLPFHAVKVIKYFTTVARERFLETLNLKWQLEKKCEQKNCDSELDVNFNDRVQLIALTEFAVFGIDRAVQDNTRSIETSFDNFYKENIPYIKDRAEKFSLARQL